MDLYNKGLDFSPESFAIAKRRVCALRTEETIKIFYDIFALMVKEGTWINAPINDRQIVYSRFRGGYYIAIYSSMENRVAGDSKDVIVTDINKFIDALYENPRVLGIIVDPNKEPYIISRKAIHELTDRKDPRLVQKDWGIGIPEYNEKDLMVPEEYLDFGMQVMEDYYIPQNGFKILETCYAVGTFPNLALQKNGEIYLVKVDCSIGEKPTYTEEERAYYLSACKRFGAKCLYASVVINPKDEERASKKLGLYGDGYFVEYYVNDVL